MPATSATSATSALGISPEPAPRRASVADIEACEDLVDEHFDGRMHFDLELMRAMSFSDRMMNVPPGWLGLIAASDHAMVAFERQNRTDRVVAFVGRPDDLDVALAAFPQCARLGSSRCDGWRWSVIRETSSCVVVREAPNPVEPPYRDGSTGQVVPRPRDPPAAPYAVSPHHSGSIVEMEFVRPVRVAGGALTRMRFELLSHVTLRIERGLPPAALALETRIEGLAMGDPEHARDTAEQLVAPLVGGDAALASIPYSVEANPEASAFSLRANLDDSQSARLFERVLEATMRSVDEMAIEEIRARILDASRFHRREPRVRLIALREIRGDVMTLHDPVMESQFEITLLDAAFDGGSSMEASTLIEDLLADGSDPSAIRVASDGPHILELRARLAARRGDRATLDRSIAERSRTCASTVEDTQERLEACVVVADVALEALDVARARAIRPTIEALLRRRRGTTRFTREADARAISVLGKLLHAEGRDRAMLRFAERELTGFETAAPVVTRELDAFRRLVVLVRSRVQPSGPAIETLTASVDAPRSEFEERPWERATLLLELASRLLSSGRATDAVARYRAAEAMADTWLAPENEFAMRIHLDALRGRELAGDSEASAALVEHIAFIRATLTADHALRIDAEGSSTSRCRGRRETDCSTSRSDRGR